MLSASISRRIFAGNAYYSDLVGFGSEGVSRLHNCAQKSPAIREPLTEVAGKVPNTMQCAASHIVRS